jgi:hypothetical protein
MRINTCVSILTGRAGRSLVVADYGQQISGNIEVFFLAQPDFGAGIIQPVPDIPRNPTSVLNSKFPGSLRHPLTKRPGFFTTGR